MAMNAAHTGQTLSLLDAIGVYYREVRPWTWSILHK
jgi:hypothetical protein